MKRIVVTITLAAAAAWILALPAAAQSHGQGHPSGGAAGSMGDGHDSGSKASGPRAVDEMLADNKQLASKLSSLLPSGTNLQAAASGFKNLGQFVAAVHVSHNLGISFASLKCTELATKDACTTMTGAMTVPSKSSSLGEAIHTLRPAWTASDSKTAAKQAQREADGDIRDMAL
jgi:hypothetical protein